MPENKIGVLFDRVIDKKDLRSDAALARLLEVAPSVISRLRSQTIVPGAVIILALAELGEIPLAEIRSVLPRKMDISRE